MILNEIFNIPEPDGITWQSIGNVEVGSFDLGNESYQILLGYFSADQANGVLLGFSNNYDMSQKLTNKNKGWLNSAAVIKKVISGTILKIKEHNLDFIVFGSAKASINDEPQKRLGIYTTLCKIVSKSTQYQNNYNVNISVGSFHIISKVKFNEEELENIKNLLNQRASQAGF